MDRTLLFFGKFKIYLQSSPDRSVYLFFGVPVFDKGILGALTHEEMETLAGWMYQSFSRTKNIWDSCLYALRKLVGKFVNTQEKDEMLGIRPIRKNLSWFGLFSPLTWIWLYLERFHSRNPLKSSARKIPSEIQVILNKLSSQAHSIDGSIPPEMEYLSIFPMFRNKILPSRRACLLS